MALSDAEIQGIAARFANPENALHGTQRVRAAAVAVDGWCDDNQASFVSALPEPFKSNSTAQHKALLLALVVARRGGLL